MVRRLPVESLPVPPRTGTVSGAGHGEEMETEPEAIEELRARHLLPPSWSPEDRATFLSPTPEVDYRSKYRGSLLAGAAGDALGRPAEGIPASEVRRRYGTLEDFQPWRNWRRGPVGTITDDTQMTMCVAESIVAHGHLVPGDLAERFIAWLPVGRGKGRTCVGAIERLESGEPWYRAGLPSAGNGAAMRVAPVGLRHASELDALRREAALSAVVTHADPMAVTSAVAQAFSVAYLLHRPAGSLDVQDYLVSLQAVLADVHDPGAPERRTGAGRGAVRLADRLVEVGDMLDLTPAEAFACLWNGAFVLESLPAALWCFLHSPEDPEQVLVTAANQGRDADTVAAMAGNLVGAYLGEAVLPRRWLDDLEYAAELRELADRLCELAEMDRL